MFLSVLTSSKLTPEQAFFPGVCAGPTYPGFAYAAESGSRAVFLSIESKGDRSKRTLQHLYYNGGGHFLLSEPHPNVQVLARYADLPDDSAAPEEAIAAVLTRSGKGKAILCSVHAEYPLNDPPARDAISKLANPPSDEEVAESEKARVEWMVELLVLLGLKPPKKEERSEKEISAVEAEEDMLLLLHPTHPSPIFVFPLPLIPEIASSTFAAPALQAKLAKGKDGVNVLRDGNDEIHILDTHAFGGESSAGAVARQLAQRRRDQPVFPPPVAQLSLEPSSTTPPPPPPPDFHSLVKTMITPSPDVEYSPTWTPLFNFQTYWYELESARKASGKRHGQLRKGQDGKERASLGDLVWYAETVTSTQTMIDR